VPDFNWENLTNYFEVRKNSYQSYFAITDKFSIEDILKENDNPNVWSTV